MSRALRLVLSGPALSALWLLLCLLYIQSQVGWDVLFQLLPHEIAIAALGVLAPIAFIWVVTGFYQRAEALTESSRELADAVAAMVFPSKASEARAREVGDSLRLLCSPTRCRPIPRASSRSSDATSPPRPSGSRARSPW